VALPSQYYYYSSARLRRRFKRAINTPGVLRRDPAPSVPNFADYTSLNVRAARLCTLYIPVDIIGEHARVSLTVRSGRLVSDGGGVEETWVSDNGACVRTVRSRLTVAQNFDRRVPVDSKKSL